LFIEEQNRNPVNAQLNRGGLTMKSCPSHRFFFAVLVLIAVVSLSAEVANCGTYSGGNGEPNNPYIIATAEDLNDIGNHPEDFNNHFIMVNDINLADYNGARFNMIGIYVGWGNPDNKPFRGVFDGNGHSIYRFTHSSTNMIPVGLFRLVNDPNARIMNLRLVEPEVDAGSGGDAGWLVGSLVGYLEDGTVANCRVEGCRVFGAEPLGGMVAESGGLITDCYAEGTVIGTYVSDDVGVLLGINWHGDVVNCSSAGYAESIWGWDVGGLVGNLSYGSMINCHSTADCNGQGAVGGLVGHNYYSSIVDSHSTGNVWGLYDLGGLVGENPYGTITGCYSTGDIAGDEYLGGLSGTNEGTITDSYSTGSASATGGYVGGLIGWNSSSTVSHCYSISRVTGPTMVAGLVAYASGSCSYLDCFWDSDVNPGLDDIGNKADDPNITGLPTAQMQDANTFIDAGWDFNTPIWKFCSLPDYPKLSWQGCPGPEAPVLDSEPVTTLGTTNTIFWDPVADANDYYAECANDANFTGIVDNSGWIADTNCTFAGLESGQEYWYRAKARDASGIESEWSNIEWSLQVTLADAVETMLDPNSLKNENMKNALLNKIGAALAMIDEEQYQGAMSKLENDILQKTDGCAETGAPDKNDWITSCEEQTEVYPLIVETIEYVMNLME
jgi:hypothetical protein